MKPLLALLAAVALGSCQKQTVAPQAPESASSSFAQGQIVAVESTRLITAPYAVPVRWRWMVELAAPLTLPGNPASSNAFSQVKTFSFTVADTAVYRRGTRISFTYQVLPWSPPQWYSNVEALSSTPLPPHYSFPEITLSNVQVL